MATLAKQYPDLVTQIVRPRSRPPATGSADSQTTALGRCRAKTIGKSVEGRNINGIIITSQKKTTGTPFLCCVRWRVRCRHD
jgi:hypothetical protein